MAEIEPGLMAELLQDALRQGKEPFLTVTSDSMAPLIRPGDQIRVSRATAEQLEPGDIVVIGGRYELLTHRFWRCIGHGPDALILTRGDRPRHYDPPTPASQLVGRVVALKRADRVLPLRSGAGAWLNAQLARLAAIDARWFAAQPAPDSSLAATTGRREAGTGTLGVRLTRRALYGLAALLTRSVALVGLSGEGRGAG